MREDHAGHRQLLHFAVHEIERCLRRLDRRQRIDHDPPRLAAHESDVREIDVTHLIDAVDHFEKAMRREKLRLPPQTRIHRGRRLPPHVLLQKVVLRQVDDRIARSTLDHRIRQIGDETALDIFEILLVREGKEIAKLRIRIERGARRIRGRDRRRLRVHHLPGKGRSDQRNHGNNRLTFHEFLRTDMENRYDIVIVNQRKSFSAEVFDIDIGVWGKSIRPLGQREHDPRPEFSQRSSAFSYELP
ncbi:hypothetical protein [Pandoraea capi]|uniref:hypothetical protein n=1 Tax=Pandoraea TaxID=93217 RepID=UPI001F5D1338|nr:hypothetical protein [Pandoraea capi]